MFVLKEFFDVWCLVFVTRNFLFSLHAKLFVLCRCARSVPSLRPQPAKLSVGLFFVTFYFPKGSMKMLRCCLHIVLKDNAFREHWLPEPHTATQRSCSAGGLSHGSQALRPSNSASHGSLRSSTSPGSVSKYATRRDFASDKSNAAEILFKKANFNGFRSKVF